MPLEVIEHLAPERGGLFVDATVGLGGHAELILSASEDVRLIGVDRDAESLDLARKRLERFGDRVTLVHDDFRNLKAILEACRADAIDGLVADLGLSSHQLAAEGRGFSFLRDEPLDMRMDRSAGATAADLLSTTEESALARILRDYAQERFARQVARAIIRAARREPVRTTGQLVRIVESVIQRRGSRIHPATRTFQALRIAVNEELNGIDSFVLDSVEMLQVFGQTHFFSNSRSSLSSYSW